MQLDEEFVEGSGEDDILTEPEHWLLYYLETWNENLSTAGVTDIALALNKPLENPDSPPAPPEGSGRVSPLQGRDGARPHRPAPQLRDVAWDGGGPERPVEGGLVGLVDPGDVPVVGHPPC